MERRLYKSDSNRLIDGVAGGLSEYFDADVTVIRIAFVLGAFFFVGILLYLLMMIVVPRRPIDQTKGVAMNTKNTGGIILGIVMILFGVSLLMETLGFQFDLWDIIWDYAVPIGLIGFGLTLIFKKR